MKGKKFPVEVFSVAPLETDPSARDWSPLTAVSRPSAGRNPHTRRRKRASVLIDESFQAKAGAKMKPIVGRKHALDQVSYPPPSPSPANWNP